MKVVKPLDGKCPVGTKVFLAGGITKCRDWQSEVIKTIEESFGDLYDLSDLVIFNPRRDDFDVNKKDEEINQIKWEHNFLTKAHIVSFFFDASESVQPITLYELGKWANKKTSVITVCRGYKRENDVLIQTALDGLYCGVYSPEDAVYQHARSILHAYELTL